MSRDTWQQREPAIQIRKLKKRVRLPVFSAPCGEVKTSVEFQAGSLSGFSTTNLAVNGSVQFTAECWIKNRGSESRQTLMEVYLVSPDDKYQWQLNLISGKLEVRVNSSGVTTLLSDEYIAFNSWTHVAVSWDGATLTLWINGNAQSTTAAPAGVLDTSAIGVYTLNICVTSGAANRFLGIIDEIKLWNIVKDPTEMRFNYDKPSATTATGLIAYLKFNDLFATTSSALQPTANYVSGSSETFNTRYPHHIITHEDTPPITFGASFVCAEFDIEVGSVCSLFFPNVPPEDCNFALMVRWVVDGVVHRRLLWDSQTNPSVIALPYSVYVGELLPANFTLEVWSDPYAATADLTAVKDLYVSVTTDPTTSKDVTPVDITVPAIDTTLAEELPLEDSPYEFDTQQTYN